MEKIQEITECCICTDIFTDPKILTCIHTFCQKCLEQTASNAKLNPGDSMPCPLCRKFFVIPNEGMVGLQRNFFMERLLEISKLSQPTIEVILCEVCKTDTLPGEETNEVPTATQFCIQCKKNICDRCCQYHKRYQELQHHELIPIGSSLKERLIRNDTLQFCDKHSKKELEMYCVDCRQVICMKCFAQKHKSHNCLDIDEVAEDLRQQMKSDLEKMNSYEAEAAARVEEIVKLKADFQEKVEDTEKAIIQRGIELKELVDKHIRSLLDEFSVIKQRVAKEIAIQQEESETHQMIINSFDKYCKELSSKGSIVEICRAGNDLHVRTEELVKIHAEQIHRQIPTAEIKFQASDLKEFLKKENLVGKIQDLRAEDQGNTLQQSSSTEVKFQASDAEGSLKEFSTVGKIQVPFQSKGKLAPPSGSLVYGVTKLQNKIYVLCQRPNVIRVFDDQNPYEFEKDVEMKDINFAWDIESCEILGCLYISSSDNRYVWRMKVDDHRVIKILTKAQIADPFSLSITIEGHLLVLREVEQLKKVEVYGSDGKLVRRISLPDGIYWPRHAIQKPNGEFLILHREGDPDGPWVISRLTSDGQKLITRFNPTDKTQKLNGPYRLALDSDNDRLFVADYSNNRVFVFDSLSLNLIEVLTKEANGINSPWRLHYDKVNKQLIIGQFMTGVEVYEAKL